MKKPPKPWQWLVTVVALLVVLGLIGVRAFAPPTQTISEKIEAGPTPVIDDH